MIRTNVGLALALGLSLVGAWGCAGQDAPRGAAEDGAASVSLLSALGMSEALQHQADELETLGDLPGAAERIREVLTIPFPEGALDREDVRLDAYGRLAELSLERGDRSAALSAIEAGRAEATRDSYFHARLLLSLGRAQQAEAAALREAGDADGARRVSLEAIQTLEESIAMNQRVLDTLAAAEETP